MIAGNGLGNFVFSQNFINQRPFIGLHFHQFLSDLGVYVMFIMYINLYFSTVKHKKLLYTWLAVLREKKKKNSLNQINLLILPC